MAWSLQSRPCATVPTGIEPHSSRCELESLRAQHVANDSVGRYGPGGLLQTLRVRLSRCPRSLERDDALERATARCVHLSTTISNESTVGSPHCIKLQSDCHYRRLTAVPSRPRSVTSYLATHIAQCSSQVAEPEIANHRHNTGTSKHPAQAKWTPAVRRIVVR